MSLYINEYNKGEVMNTEINKNTERKKELMKMIKSLCKKYNKSQVELGALLNLKQGRFSNLMDSDNYHKKFSIDKLLSYLDILGYSLMFEVDKNDKLIITKNRNTEKRREENLVFLKSISKEKKSN